MNHSISSSAVIYPDVHLGEGCKVGEFAIIGNPLNGGETPETNIGPNGQIRSHTVIYAGNGIGSGLQTGHGAMIRESNTIGDNVSIGSQSTIEHHVTIGDGVRVHSQVFVPEYSVLEAGAWLGPNVCLTNARYPAAPRTKEFLSGVRIERNSRIGANATILPGITIGEGALVGAGAVVTRDVKPGTVVLGNPAKIIAQIEDLTYGPEWDNEAVYPAP